MYWKDNYNNIYGPFSEQEDGFPNAGEVIRHYRKLMRLSQRALAEALGVHRSWVLKMENENTVPELLSRRRVIADFLKIPPVLLGVGVFGAYLEPLGAHSNACASSLASYSMQEAQEYLDAAWELYNCGGSFNLLSGVRRWKARIEEGTVQKGQNLDLLHQYELFLLKVGRERQDYTSTSPTRLVDLARQIDDPDVLALSLYRKGRIYSEQQNYDQARKDIREALSIIEHASPRIKGLVLSNAGPILAYHATDQTDVNEVMSFLDEAYTYLEPAKNDPDTLHTYFNEAYFLDRASSIVPLLKLDPSLIDEVWETLDLAQEQTRPEHIRRRTSIELFSAKAAFYAGDYLPAASTALEALELAQSIGSGWGIAYIQRLYNQLTQTKMKDSSELRKLRQALAKKENP